MEADKGFGWNVIDGRRASAEDGSITPLNKPLEGFKPL